MGEAKLRKNGVEFPRHNVPIIGQEYRVTLDDVERVMLTQLAQYFNTTPNQMLATYARNAIRQSHTHIAEGSAAVWFMSKFPWVV